MWVYNVVNVLVSEYMGECVCVYVYECVCVWGHIIRAAPIMYYVMHGLVLDVIQILIHFVLEF